MHSVGVYYTIKLIVCGIIFIPMILFCLFLFIKAIAKQCRYNKNTKYLEAHEYRYELKSTPNHYCYFNYRIISNIDCQKLYDMKLKDLKDWVEKEESKYKVQGE